MPPNYLHNLSSMSKSTPDVQAFQQDRTISLSLLHLEIEKTGLPETYPFAHRDISSVIDAVFEESPDGNYTEWFYHHILATAIAQKDSVEIVKSFVENNLVDLNYRIYGERSALHIAAENCSVKCLTYLIETSQDVDILSNIGDTPLHYAALYGTKDVVRLLLSAGMVIQTS